MAIHHCDAYRNRNKQGQSFVELSLILVIILILLIGVVEFGFLINNYLKVLNGGREAARVNNSYAAFVPITFDTIPTFYYAVAERAATTMDPVILNASLGDDIVISVITLGGGTYGRYPVEHTDGWSLCENYPGYAAYYYAKGLAPISQLANGWNGCIPHHSHFSDADILARAGAGALPSGLLVVEIYYNYPQLLKIPLFTDGDFMGVKFSLIPDPVPVYTYTIMPMSSAEPRQNP